MVIRIWFLFSLFAFVGNKQVLAQADLGRALSNTVKNNKPSLLLRLESRDSFIGNSGVHTNGIKLGANFGPNLNLGIGYHYLTNKSAERINRNLGNESDGLLNLQYAAFFVEYRFFDKGRYSASIPIQLGFGNASYSSNRFDLSRAQTVILYETMLNGEVRFLKFFGLGAGLGYRLNLSPANPLQLPLTSPIYNVRFNVFFQELYNEIKK